jgi:RNA polymerase sigma factor (sigma-70 family)
MTDTTTTMTRDAMRPMTDVDHDPLVAAAKAGDEAAFATLVERHRRELHVHCYRMLGSFEEAEDLVQETFLRAWRSRDSFVGGPGFRAWLYRIATNASLDAIRTRSRRVASLSSFAEVPWLQPYPDRLLDEVAPSESEPDAVVVARETIELTFVAVIQLLPPQQRAVLILRDVLDWRPPRPPPCSTRRWPPPTARCSAPGRRCAISFPSARRTVPPPRTSAPTSARCCRGSSRPTSAGTPRPPPRCCATTSA